MLLAPSEEQMWAKEPKPRPEKLTDDEINQKYSAKQERIVTEAIREKLPNFVEALKRPNHIMLRPIYQRRPRWDPERQSQLIESFIINIPIPPLFLYETSYDTYEVMDGQQRIQTIWDFYTNQLILEGLERWPELNGRTYSKLPAKIKAGIDRRSISYIVLLTESAETDEDAMLLKQLIFERLNTGGIQLTKQEVRNALFQGLFNQLLLELAKNDVFRAAWEIPPATQDEDRNPSDELKANSLYSKMEDVEVILRFFALRHVEQYQRGMQGFLDLYMARSQRFGEKDIQILRDLFFRTVQLGHEIYGDIWLKPYDVKRGDWAPRAQKAFSDAVMVGLSRNLSFTPRLISKRNVILEETKNLFKNYQEGTFTGRGNTKRDVEERINLYSAMLSSVASSGA